MKYLNRFLLNENVAQANSLLKRLKISEKDTDYIKLRQMLQGHDGYVYWFTKLRFSDNQTMEDLKTIWDLIKDTNGITSFFTKKIVDLESVEDFWDQYEASKIYSIAKKVLNQFPSRQKTFFNLKDTSDLDILTQLGKSKSLPALIKKISSFRDKKSLLDAANRLLTSSFDGKFGELIKSINGVDANIVVADEEKNIIICQVDYEQIRVLGGDTSWCIVRAKSTFDGYANGGFQWVIFLVDNFGVNDRMSKIGLTTNTGYSTAHDKYDGYISKDKIQEILKDRGVNLSDLYISKEVLLGMSNWDLIPVETLIDKGISKQEIVKRKLVFKRGYNRISISNSDISFFTDEEIEKWNLLERSELTWQDVTKMSFDFVIRINALNRLVSVVNFINVVEHFKLTKEQIIKYKIYDNKSVVNSIETLKFFTKDEIIKNNIINYIANRCVTILDLFDMGFTKEEIIKYKLFNSSCVYINSDGLAYFTKDELIKYKIINNNVSSIPFNVFVNIGFTKEEIIKKYSNNLDALSSKVIRYFAGKTKKQVLKRLSDTFWSDDLKELGIDRNERGELNKFKILAMSIYDIDSTLVPILGRKRGEVSLVYLLNDKLDINKENIDTLINLGYKPNIEFDNFTELFISDTNYGNIVKTYNYVKYRELFNDNKELYDLCTKKLISSINGNIDCDYFSLLKYKDVLSKMPEYDALLNQIKSNKSIYGLKTKSSDSRSSSYGHDIDKTIDFIKELKFTKSEIELKGGISKFCEAFEVDRLYDSDINQVIDFFKSYGFKIDEKEEINIIAGMLRNPYNNSSSSEIRIYKEDYYKTLIVRGIKVEDSLDSLFNYYYKLKNSNDEESKYRELFSKGGDKYIKMFEEETINIKERELHINVIKGLKSLFSSRYSAEKDRQDWYDKYFSVYNTMPGSSHKWDKFENDIKVIWVLASLNKFDDFNKIHFNFTSDSNRGFSFDDNQIHSFAKGLCEKARDLSIANNVRENILTNAQLGEIYKWLLTKVDTSKVFVNKYLLVCYYWYENKRYEDFINNKLNTIKNNYGSSSKVTMRLDVLRYILKYFREENDFDDFKGLLDKFFINVNSSKVNKMGINEYKRTIKYLDDNFETTRSEFGKKVGAYIDEIESKYSKSFLKPVKESFILRWSDFK